MTISVRDQGPGIPAEHRHQIFDRFYRVKDGPARPGTGLGLYIARTLVEAMSGRIWVDSELGAGATFSFTLQTVDAERSTAVELDDVPDTAESLLIRIP